MGLLTSLSSCHIQATIWEINIIWNISHYIQNPDKVAQMSPDQITQLLPTLGQELTGRLAEMRQQMNTKAGMLDARMDSDDFNNTAQQLGLNPYSNTQADKANIGQLRYRVDQVLQQAQAANKAPLTREQKVNIMQDEMARTVVVDPGHFSSNKTEPIIQLSPDEAKRWWYRIPTSNRRSRRSSRCKRSFRTIRRSRSMTTISGRFTCARTPWPAGW